MVVGFTGTQRGMTRAQQETVAEALSALDSVDAAHHGDCVGADAEFHQLCCDLALPIHLHPPSDASRRAFCRDSAVEHPEKAYLDRNRDIVGACQLLIAAPRESREKRHSGTWATIRYARKENKRIWIVLPDGRVSVEP